MKTTEKYIAEARERCKTKSDHDFVDAWANIMVEFEKPREQINPFENMYMSDETKKKWDDMLADEIKKYKL